MRFKGNSWITVDPSSGRVSAGGDGLVILGIAGLLVGAFLFWKYILLFIVFVLIIVAVAGIIYLLLGNRGNGAQIY